MLSPAIYIIIAQRLVRKVCDNCKVIQKLDDSSKKELEDSLKIIQQIRPEYQNLTLPDKLPKGAGCDVCSHTGYKGRTQITEVLKIDFQIRDLILQEASQVKFIELARQKGMLTMREDGILKVLDGITTLEEVHRVANVL
ncbi:MAG: type II secretion system protein e, type IV pilus assembly protein PilB [Candidatus Peregrinibacteria bacterium GW2011_GWF2_33_10]|nr:MAG: type II secretion system protein e, type IV pilus assembly protein PilB [Candidatus Peregrinibacteria bacterium GW2011_GWF2_33_10]